MTKPIIRIHDLATNEIIDREMNDEEYAQHQKDQTLNAAMLIKETKRQAILDRLGLTADEAALLLGAN
jgi:hypothetical protein